jgi:uncharacterized membrane protein (UPF0127 family)
MSGRSGEHDGAHVRRSRSLCDRSGGHFPGRGQAEKGHDSRTRAESRSSIPVTAPVRRRFVLYLMASIFPVVGVSCAGSPEPAATTETTESVTTRAVPTTGDDPAPVSPTTDPTSPTATTVESSTTTEPDIPSSPTLAGFGQTEIHVGNVPLSVLVADTPALRAQGLTRVEELPRGIEGMLFVFERTSEVNFTMRRTLIPLDIWWFDDRDILIGSTAMQPCTADPCDLYPSPGPIKWALETPEDSVQLAEGAGLRIG